MLLRVIRTGTIGRSLFSHGLLFLSLVSLFLPAFHAADANPGQGFLPGPSIPSEYGEVIFSCNADSPNQLYIIGTGHRDTLSGANGAYTVKSQIDVYRIGEWLIRNRGLELLLPEGFFRNKPAKDEDGKSTEIASPAHPGRRASPDTKELEEKLEEDCIYTNAEMLLIESHGIKSRQVEDADLYHAATARIGLIEKNRDNPYALLTIKSDLDYLQERRTAAMLQKIPGIIENEYSEGGIRNKSALFTIGLDHISEIIRYLEQKKIAIHSPAFTSFDDYFSAVNLLDKNFGVTIIIPRTLADNRDIIRLSSLENIR